MKSDETILQNKHRCCIHHLYMALVSKRIGDHFKLFILFIIHNNEGNGQTPRLIWYLSLKPRISHFVEFLLRVIEQNIRSEQRTRDRSFVFFALLDKDIQHYMILFKYDLRAQWLFNDFYESGCKRESYYSVFD